MSCKFFIGPFRKTFVSRQEQPAAGGKENVSYTACGMSFKEAWVEVWELRFFFLWWNFSGCSCSYLERRDRYWWRNRYFGVLHEESFDGARRYTTESWRLCDDCGRAVARGTIPEVLIDCLWSKSGDAVVSGGPRVSSAVWGQRASLGHCASLW